MSTGNEPQAPDNETPNEGRPADFRDAILLLLVFLVVEILLGFLDLLIHVGARWNLFEAGLKLIAIAVVWYLVRRRLGGDLAAYVGTPAKSPAVYLLVIAGVVGIHLFIQPVESLLYRISSAYRYFDSLLSGTYQPRDLFGTFLQVVIVAPATEEFMLRGVILRGFARHYRLSTALFLSALLFAFFHHNLAQFLGPFCSGLLFGAALLRGASLYPCLAGHVLTNALWFAAKASPDVSRLLRLGVQGDEAGLLAARIVLGVLLAGLSVLLLLAPLVGRKDEPTSAPVAGTSRAPAL